MLCDRPQTFLGSLALEFSQSTARGHGGSLLCVVKQSDQERFHLGAIVASQARRHIGKRTHCCRPNTVGQSKRGARLNALNVRGVSKLTQVSKRRRTDRLIVTRHRHLRAHRVNGVLGSMRRQHVNRLHAHDVTRLAGATIGRHQ